MGSGAYHSQFNEKQNKGQPIPFRDRQYISNLPLLPLRATTFKGPAPQGPSDQEDIIDEALRLFKPNILFRNFEVLGYADRLLVYITLYISSCLNKIPHKSKGEAEKILYSYAIEPFSIPGDKTFCLGGLVTPPRNRGEAETLRAYLTQIRQETYTRFLEIVYAHDDREPDKWWTCFSKRKFLNKSI